MRIIVPIVLLFFIACNSPQPSNESTSQEPTSIDTATVLNQLNTQNTIISNSAAFIEMEQTNKFVPFNFISDKGLTEKLFDNSIPKNYTFDSIYSQLTEDSLIIENYFYTSGDCGEYRIVKVTSKTGVMFWRKAVLDGEVNNGELETYGCTLTNITALRFSLPLKDYPFPAIGYNNQVIPLTNQ